MEKWRRAEIELLIKAYKKETCLYVTTDAKYHNKNLRREALGRICEQVKKLRPTACPKECLAKLNNLRNRFNLEQGKVRAYYNSGTNTEDIYQPALWYYPKLLFLKNYLKPRKSWSSLENTDMGSDSQQDSVIMDNEPEIDVQQLASDNESEIAAITPLVQLQEQDEAKSQNSPSPGISGIPQSPSKKERSSSDDDYVAAIHKLADSLKKPIKVTTIERTESSSTSLVCPVDSFMNFIGSLLRNLQDEQLKLELMNNITQTVINAKSLDIQRANK